MGEIALKHPGVQDAIAFPGLSIKGFTNSSNSGIVFASLKPFDQRKSKDMSGGAIAGQLNKEFAAIPDAFIAIFPPAAGAGARDDGRLQAADRGPRPPSATRRSTAP
jgi:multidrug efflux pump